MYVPVALCGSSEMTDVSVRGQVRYTRDVPIVQDDDEDPSPVLTRNQIITTDIAVTINPSTRRVWISLPEELTRQMRVGDSSWSLAFSWPKSQRKLTVLRGEIQVESEIGERDDMA